VVKVVVDENNYALYFSRSLIPYPRHDIDLNVYEHIGIYVYRKNFLKEYLTWPQGKLEKIESLEQLRVLEKGYKILVIETKSNRLAGMSVDTPEELKNVEHIIKEKRLGYEL
jgi:3-deoxy-manno-octulosonate cytidylyltransferase (CMP-KDO synthetase)